MRISAELADIKREVFGVADRLHKENLLRDEAFKIAKEVVEKEKLTIAVVGQMKYGKSTFINALLFGKRLLPTGHTPTTAVLSAIEYGEEEEFEVEFYSREEIESIIERQKKLQSQGAVFSEDYEELLERHGSLLGQKKILSKDELREYVSAGGGYAPITKWLKIKYPAEVLREIVIVDTPGVNDPIIEREKKTYEFLRRADIVIVFLYAKRPFDKTDRELIADKIFKKGTGKIVIVLNQIDELMSEGNETLEKVKNHVVETLREVIEKELNLPNIKKELSNAPVHSVSSLMALIGRMKSGNHDEDISWYMEKFKGEMPFLKTKEDFEKYSGIRELEKEIEDIGKREKERILADKLKTLIVGDLSEQIRDIGKRKRGIDYKRQAMQLSLKEIEKKKKELENLKKELSKKEGELQEEHIGPLIKDIEHLKSDMHELAIEKKKEIYKKIEEYEVGFFDDDDFKRLVNIETREALLDIVKECRERSEKVGEKFSETINRLLKDLTKVPEVREFRFADTIRGMDYDSVIGLRNELVKKYSFGPGRELYERAVEIREVDVEWFLVFGDSPNEAKEKARKTVKENFDNLLNKIEENLEQVRNLIIQFSEKALKEFEKGFILPVKEALTEANLKKRDKEATYKKLDEEEKRLDERLEALERARKRVELELGRYLV